PKHRAVGLTETVAKASAGAIEHVPVVRVTNIAQTIDRLKKKKTFGSSVRMNGSRKIIARSMAEARSPLSSAMKAKVFRGSSKKNATGSSTSRCKGKCLH